MEAISSRSDCLLFDKEPDWFDYWQGMPEFSQEDLTPWKSVQVHFSCRDDMSRFAEAVGQKLTPQTRSLWYPPAEIGSYVDKRYKAKRPALPKYPVYIISKGRADSRLTVKSLDAIGVPYRVVIEPQEFDTYAAVINPDRILTLPFSNLGQGSIPARNWVWEHSLSEGHARHWILDDNIGQNFRHGVMGFFYLNNNLKTPVGDGTIFRIAERFVDRYSNVAISGFNYFMFAARKTVVPPIYLNTRIYSCILIDNNIPYRWRGRYNEDTDLSLRALKDGWCTVLFNAFLCWKQQTMTMTGGNTDELYKGNGRLLMAESLRQQHPDVVKVTEKWGRPHHHVDYRPFSRNRLQPRDNAEICDLGEYYHLELFNVPRRQDAGQ